MMRKKNRKKCINRFLVANKYSRQDSINKYRQISMALYTKSKLFSTELVFYITEIKLGPQAAHQMLTK